MALVASLGVVAASSSGDAAPSHSSGQKSSGSGTGVTTLSALAVVESGGGEWNGEVGRLTLTDVKPTAVWFTDRPARQVGSYDVGVLVGMFLDGQTPANAALEYQDPSSGDSVAIVEISKPNYDEPGQTLSLDARILKDPENSLQRRDTALVDFVHRQNATIPPSFAAATLFIDSAPAPSTSHGAGAASAGGCDRVTMGSYVGCEVTGHVPATQTSETFVKSDCSSTGYVARKGAASVTDSPLVSVSTKPKVPALTPIYLATKSVPYKFLSRLGTAIIVGLIIPSFTEYHVTAWCTGSRNQAWVIAG